MNVSARRSVECVYLGVTYSLTPSFKAIDAMEDASGVSAFHLPLIFTRPKVGMIARVMSAAFRANGHSGEAFEVDAMGDAIPEHGEVFVRTICTLLAHYLGNAKELDGGGDTEKKQEPAQA